MLAEGAGAGLVNEVAGEVALGGVAGAGVDSVGALGPAGSLVTLFSRRPMRKPPTANVPMMIAITATVTQRRRSARTASCSSRCVSGATSVGAGRGSMIGGVPGIATPLADDDAL